MPSRAAGEYLRFLAWAVGLAAILALVGYLPTGSLAGARGIPAMLAGCAVGLLASALGGLPIYLARRTAGPGSGRAETAALGGMGVRFAAAFGLGFAVVLSGWFERGPLLAWVAVSYVALLVIDTRYALGRI
jgi:hypothetical protein